MRQESLLSMPVLWRAPHAVWGLLAVAALGLGIAFHAALAGLYATWTTREEYSFGILVPFIAAFLVWQRRDQLAATRFEASWAGVGVLLAGLALGAVAQIATAGNLAQYAFVVALAGLALAAVGRHAFAVLAAPLAMLVFMLPLPELLLGELSRMLQLLSSQLGVWLIRMAGVSVYLEGNVIDLGTMKLQVVEACSGLRYLLPLITLGCITAFFFRAPLWQRAALVASTAPITLLMNSVRIGLIGVTVEHIGPAAAEGLLHDFEGWAVFMTCMGVLFAEMWLFARLSGRRFREVFAIDLPAGPPIGAERRLRTVPPSLIAAVALLAGAALAQLAAPQPESQIPARREFSQFPLALGAWQGRSERMNPLHLDILKLDDYLLANYTNGGAPSVNLYMGYYAVQRHGLAAHSPSECLPADGWEMQRFQRHIVPGVQAADGAPLEVNRVVIQKGQARQLVYYWFQQRERSLRGEYAVKAYLFWDLLTRQRSDGALVRLVTPMPPGEGTGEADRRLAEFSGLVMTRLPSHVPG
jgi:exosortase D (VPLPA-CTERM-specific)